MPKSQARSTEKGIFRAVRSKLRMEDTVTVHLEVPPIAVDAISIETVSVVDITTQAQILNALKAMGSLGDESSTTASEC